MPQKEISPKAILQSSDLFGNLCEDCLNDLVAELQSVKFKSNKVLFIQGDEVNGCYVVLDGIIKISLIESEGEETMLSILGKGDIVGEMGVISKNRRSATATVLKDCTLGYLSTDKFEQLANANPEIYKNLLMVLCQRLKATNQSFVNQRLALHERLARTMVNLAESFGEQLPDGRIRITHKITQVQLGRMTNASRENINRQLSAWRDEGRLSQLSGFHCLHDMDKWKALARLDSL